MDNIGSANIYSYYLHVFKCTVMLSTLLPFLSLSNAETAHLNFVGEMNKCRRERILIKVSQEELALFDLPVYMSQGWFSL